ncbi:SpoIIE family protein phosphatase [Pendulispora brunnea]|uniref:SpoIIE family protein phosphatase n=1 Tax=Pendulispora brunnea TaxID=2905690 RepID=A0ABZ2K3K4_9BACT
MDTLLIEGWLEGLDRTPMIDEASVALVREQVRAIGAELSLSKTVIGSLVNVASELGHNQLRHARRGSIAIRRIERGGVPGLEIVAADTGDGIVHPAQAIQGKARGESSGGDSLGVGLAAVVELADEVDFDVRMQEGTCIWARKFAAAVPRRRQVGIYGRPHPEERISGDDGMFVRQDDALLVGVADGLGHGYLARDASSRAVETVREHAPLGIERTLEKCHATLAGTRGAVMTVARVNEPGDTVEAAYAGNVNLHIYGPRGARRGMGPSIVLGMPNTKPKAWREDHALDGRDVLVLFSDGLTTRTDIDGEFDLLREHPIVVAQALADRFGRDNDDLLVLVAR